MRDGEEELQKCGKEINVYTHIPRQVKNHTIGDIGLRTVALYIMAIDSEQQEGLNIKRSFSFIFQSG